MGIKHNGSLEEAKSPFFEVNRKICEDWEKYILQQVNGVIRGKFNSWSFNFSARINKLTPIDITVKKSTYTSGILLFSSKYQNLDLRTQIKVSLLNPKSLNFTFKRKTLSSRLRYLFTKKSYKLETGPYYIFGEAKENPFVIKLLYLLSKPLENKELSHLKFLNESNTLSMELLNIDLDTSMLNGLQELSKG